MSRVFTQAVLQAGEVYKSLDMDWTKLVGHVRASAAA